MTSEAASVQQKEVFKMEESKDEVSILHFFSVESSDVSKPVSIEHSVERVKEERPLHNKLQSPTVLAQKRPKSS